MKNIVIFGSFLILVIFGCRHNDKISKFNSSNRFNCILDSSYSEYLLNNNLEDTIIRFWKLLNYGPISLIEINLNNNEMHYYQIDKMNLTSKEEKYMGWYNSKHKNVMIRFFHLDSLRINYSKIITELKNNQAIDDYTGEPENTSYFIQGNTDKKQESYSLPYSIVSNSYTDSIIKIIFTNLSWLEAINYYKSTRIISYSQQIYFDDSIRPRLMARKDYLIDSAEVVPQVKNLWWLDGNTPNNHFNK